MRYVHLNLIDRRHLEIKGYSEEVTCTHYEDCMPTDENSESCGVYEATVVVAFDDEGEDNTSASRSVLHCHWCSRMIVSQMMTLRIPSMSNLMILGRQRLSLDMATQTETKKPAQASTVKSFKTRTVEMASLGQAKLQSLPWLHSWYCYSSYVVYAGVAVVISLHEDKSVGSGNTELSPSRRLFGSRSGSRSGGSQTDDDMTYMTSDFNNLGMHHSKLDVHACSSASCDQCNPIMRQQTAGVYFVGSQGGSPLSDILEEECKSSSEYKSEQARQRRTTLATTPFHRRQVILHRMTIMVPRKRRASFQDSVEAKHSQQERPLFIRSGTVKAGDEQIEIEI